MARIPRKSSASAPGTLAACQFAPPSVVLRYVPPVPLAHTILSLMALTPRSDAVVLLVCGVQAWPNAIPAIQRQARRLDKQMSIQLSYSSNRITMVINYYRHDSLPL